MRMKSLPIRGELRHAYEKLERSNRELEEFAYAVSHDLQEPIRAVTNHCQAILQKYAQSLGPEAREHLRFAVDGAKRMQEQVRALLEYSRVGRETTERREEPMEAIVREVVHSFHPLVTETHATIRIGPLPRLFCHRAQIVQLIQNLVGNALKFRNGRRPEIEISARRERDEWIFSVSDNGIGIDSRHFERIFVIFQRLHTQDEFAGEGIGLATCKKVVEHHGGRIWLRSKPGEGSCFFFSLPAQGGESAKGGRND